MLGQPISMLIPEVIGFRLTGKLREGVTATDLVLTVTQMLRKKGVVGKFVEFFGPGLDDLALEDRATIGNMAPEYGATCGFFPIDAETIRYLAETGRDADAGRAGRGLRQGAGPVARRDDARPGLHRHARRSTSPPSSRRSPGRSGRRTASLLAEAKKRFVAALDSEFKKGGEADKRVPVEGADFRHRPRRRGDRRDHLLHQHLQSERHDRRRAARQQRRGEGPEGQAVGEDLAGAGQPGRQRLSGEVGPAGRSRPARLQSRRLRLHHLHRQFRSAGRADLRGDRQGRSGRRGRAVGQSQFRGPRQSRTSGPTISPRRRSSSPMRWPARCRSISSTSRSAPTRTASRSISATSGRRPRRSPSSSARTSRASSSAGSTATSSAATSTGRAIKVEGGLTYEWNPGLDLRPEPALFREDGRKARADHRHRRRPRPRPLRRFHHHRPHLAGRLDPREEPGRRLSDRAPGAAGRLQLSTARGAAITR